MSIDRIKAVHDELHFDQYVEKLKMLGGLWTQIQTLQQRARRDPSGLSTYKSFLRSAIAKLVADGSDLMTPEEADAECARYVALYNQRSHAAADTVERRGGLSIEAWSERWLKAEHRRYRAAMDDLADNGPTRARFARLFETTTELFDAYADGIGRTK